MSLSNTLVIGVISADLPFVAELEEEEQEDDEMR